MNEAWVGISDISLAERWIVTAQQSSDFFIQAPFWNNKKRHLLLTFMVPLLNKINKYSTHI